MIVCLSCKWVMEIIRQRLTLRILLRRPGLRAARVSAAVVARITSMAPHTTTAATVARRRTSLAIVAPVSLARESDGSGGGGGNHRPGSHVGP